MGPSNALHPGCQGATLRFTILGPLEVRGTDGAAVRLPAGRARTVLGLLCLSPGRVVSQDWLIDLAWNGTPPTSATTRLHGFVSELRRALPVGPEPVIRTVGRGYSLAVAEDRIDLYQARGLVAQARAHGERGDAAAAVGGLEGALALWRGPAFEGIECAYLQAEADAIEQEHADALEQLAELELILGRHAALVPRLGELVARYPLREGLRASLMRALAGSGRQAEAIDTYHELRRRLADELGVDPAPQVRELYASILDGDPQLLAPRPAQASARPLPAQLPADTSDFTGRRGQVRRLREALAPDVDGSASAVVSVVSGPGGIGKSALAVHVAHLLADAFPDGQLFVNLAGMSGSPLAPTDVIARLLRDLGIGADDVPADEAEPLPAWAGAQLPEFANHRAAMEWCEREYPALMWAVQEAARRRRPGLAANMACWMWAYATRALTPADYVMCPRIGLECAREIGAEHAQRWLLNCLGSALGRIAEHESAIDCYRQAIDLGRRTGDDAGGAASLNNIANIRHEQGRYADAVAYYLAAAEAAEAAGRPDHVGVILVNAANSNRDMGAYAEALDVYSRALEILLAADSAYQVAAARSGLGDTLRLLGRLEESLAQHELAVAIQRDLGTRDRHFLDALDWLGQAYAACGRHDEARRCWTEALRLADETGSPLAATLRRRT